MPRAPTRTAPKIQTKPMMKFRVLGSSFSNGGDEHYVRGDVVPSERDLAHQFRNGFLRLSDDADPTPPRTLQEVREIKNAIREGRPYGSEPQAGDYNNGGQPEHPLVTAVKDGSARVLGSED